MYTLHLLFIYGNFASFNFVKKVNHTLGFAQALVATMILIALMVAIAYGWGRIRKMDPRVKPRIQWAVTIALLLVFFFGPGE